MQIENEIKTRRIEMTVVDSEVDNYPGFRVKIDIKTEEFQGSFDRGIWLSEVDIYDFIKRLEVFEQTSKGCEMLTSMSPDEFVLGIKNIDDLGHCSVLVRLRKESIHTSYKDDLTVEFEIDPMSAKKMIVDLKKILSSKV